MVLSCVWTMIVTCLKASLRRASGAVQNPACSWIRDTTEEGFEATAKDNGQTDAARC